MTKLKELHCEEIKQLREELRAVRDNLTSKTNEIKELRKQYE
jgi:hypothetical protein